MLHRENKIGDFTNSSAADLLQETLDYYHITQSDFAARIGVSQKNVSDILHRKRYLTPQLAVRVEAVTGISSRLLLSLDANYRLHQAENAPNDVKQASPLFLKRYDWVTG